MIPRSQFTYAYGLMMKMLWLTVNFTSFKEIEIHFHLHQTVKIKLNLLCLSLIGFTDLSYVVVNILKEQ